MGSLLSDYIKNVEKTASEDQQGLLDAFSNYYRDRFDRPPPLVSLIAAARKDAGMTQAQLAEASEISQPEISRIESGGGNPTLETFQSLLRPLGLHLALVDRSGNLVGSKPLSQKASG